MSSPIKNRYYLLFKPYGYLSQFTAEHPGHQILATLCEGIPKDVFPVGRLDKDSEGLLLLTNDRSVNHRLLNPAFQHHRIYLAQVEGIPDENALNRLRQGPVIKVNKAPYKTLGCEATLLMESPELPDRNPPIRFRKTVPDSWIQLRLTEGKNRQVRKMCAAIGHPVLRLVRWAIEAVTIENLELGELKEVTKQELYGKLKLKG